MLALRTAECLDLIERARPASYARPLNPHPTTILSSQWVAHLRNIPVAPAVAAQMGKNGRRKSRSGWMKLEGSTKSRALLNAGSLISRQSQSFYRLAGFRVRVRCQARERPKLDLGRRVC